MLGEYVLSSEDYKQLPYLHPGYAEYWFESTDLLSYFIHKGSFDFPKIYPHFGKFVEFVDIPISQNLQMHQQYCVSLIKKHDCHLAIINGKDFFLDEGENSQWRHDRQVWTISFIPQRRGLLTLSIRDINDQELYHNVLEYKIKRI